MPIRIVKQPISICRKGEHLRLEVGQQFEFTDRELKDLTELNESAIGYIVTADTPVAEPAKVK